MCWTDLDKNTYGVNRELHGSGKEGRARERIKLQTRTRKKKKKNKRGSEFKINPLLVES